MIFKLILINNDVVTFLVKLKFMNELYIFSFAEFFERTETNGNASMKFSILLFQRKTKKK